MATTIAWDTRCAIKSETKYMQIHADIWIFLDTLEVGEWVGGHYPCAFSWNNDAIKMHMRFMKMPLMLLKCIANTLQISSAMQTSVRSRFFVELKITQ